MRTVVSFVLLAYAAGCSLDWQASEPSMGVDPAESGDAATGQPRDGDAGTDLDAAPGASDAGAPDGGSEPYAVATPGAACSPDEAETLACDGHASRKALKCSGGVWTLFATCAEDERCQSTRGPLQGLCTTMPAECAGQSPETPFCAASGRVACDLDLLAVLPLACPEHTVCDGAVEGLCRCADGYESDGAGGCRIADDCATQPCVHGACVDGVASYTCQCDPGFTGAQCEVDIDECASAVCLNGSTCVDAVNGYTCACAPGFAGTACEVNIDDCASQPCLNGARCDDGVNAFTCACQAGYEGERCETNIDDCQFADCGSAACIDLVDGYRCQCGRNEHFDGSDCVPNCGLGVLCP